MKICNVSLLIINEIGINEIGAVVLRCSNPHLYWLGTQSEPTVALQYPQIALVPKLRLKLHLGQAFSQF